ncbi:MAG: DNA-formamidopyrimidine glycosylase family protein [Saprospiraceae bacterium]
MPELPEVATYQKTFESAALGKTIRDVVVHDAKILRNLNAEQFIECLVGRRFTGSYRRGKFLFGALDNGAHLQLHFGMTGDLFPYQDPADAPRFERFRLEFDDGSCLGFDDSRKFSHIVWVEDLSAYLEARKLGPDALEIEEAGFLELMAKRKGQLKAFLLDQHAVAGVGNLYADEICFQARIHPASRLDKLTDEHKRLIFKLMQEILHSAVERLAYYKEYPEDWFWEWRKLGKPGPEGIGIVQRATIAGRTTYFVEGWQTLL